MSLKELTWEKHKSAERQEFVKVLMSGNINPRFYANFLSNQKTMYQLLEITADKHNLFEGMTDLKRTNYIDNDIVELGFHRGDTVFVPVINEYLDHVLRLSQKDSQKLMAHIYVRYMGDLYGGQMIAKKIPGSGTFYKFKNPEELKNTLRSRLTNDLADEANLCFDFAIELYRQLMMLTMPKYINE